MLPLPPLFSPQSLFKRLILFYWIVIRSNSSIPSRQIIVLGDYAVGKTAIIKRYTEGLFTPNVRLFAGSNPLPTHSRDYWNSNCARESSKLVD